MTGGTNWWGARDGAPNAGPYGDFQNECLRTSTRSAHRRSSSAPPGGRPCPWPTRRSTISADTYACTGAESDHRRAQPLHPDRGSADRVPSRCRPVWPPGAYNIYIDESNTTPLPGNGPNDAYQTARGTSLGTVAVRHPAQRRGCRGGQDLDHLPDGGYGAAGDTIDLQLRGDQQRPGHR